jgi:hypothetical protein
MNNPFQSAARRARIVVAWVRMRLAEIHLHAVIDLIDRDIGKPMPHEQRKQLLLRRCFAELAADVRRQEYLDALGLQKPMRSEQPAACIRRRARISAC